MTKFATLTVLAALMLSAGCEQPGSGTPSDSPQVGVVDLDQVARETGQLAKMSGALQNLNQQFDKQIQVATISLRDQINERASAMQAEDEEMTDEERAQLTNLTNAANQRIQAGRTRAQQIINTQRNQLIAQYREMIRPYVSQAAREHGLDVVLVKAHPVFFSAAEVDITVSVIDAYIKAPPPAPPIAPVSTPPANTGSSDAAEGAPAEEASGE